MTTTTVTRRSTRLNDSATRPGTGARAVPTISPYAAHLALLNGAADVVADEPEVVERATIVTAVLTAPVASPTPSPVAAPVEVARRRDMTMRDGVVGFVVGVTALALLLAAAASLAATHA